jgi:hypothetical protein
VRQTRDSEIMRSHRLMTSRDRRASRRIIAHPRRCYLPRPCPPACPARMSWPAGTAGEDRRPRDRRGRRHTLASVLGVSSRDRGHGRVELRRLQVTSVAGLDFPHATQAIRSTWAGGRTWRTVTVEAVTSLTIHKPSSAHLAGYLRGHWRVKTQLHDACDGPST